MLLFWRERGVDNNKVSPKQHLLEMEREVSLPPSGGRRQPCFGGNGRGLVISAYLDEFEDGKRGHALLCVDAAQDAVELRVEAAVAESQQEAAQQSDGHAEGRGHSFRPKPLRSAPPPAPLPGNGLPGSQIGLLLGGGAEDDRRVVGRVEEDQVEGHKMDDHSQEHHRGPSEPIVLAQQPEQPPAWREQPARETRIATTTPPDPNPELKPTHDLPDAHHDPRDADQAFGRRSELRGRPDAGPVDAAVEGQLQAWRASSELSPAHLSTGGGRLYIPLYAMQGLRSTMTLSLSSCLMVSEHEKHKEDAQIPHLSRTRRPPSEVTGGGKRRHPVCCPHLTRIGFSRSAASFSVLTFSYTGDENLPTSCRRPQIPSGIKAWQAAAAPCFTGRETKASAIASEQRLTTRRFHLFSCSLYLFY